jgi:hypothetical protein
MMPRNHFMAKESRTLSITSCVKHEAYKYDFAISNFSNSLDFQDVCTVYDGTFTVER